jgi:uncharacterized protein (DUF885 family)
MRRAVNLAVQATERARQDAALENDKGGSDRFAAALASMRTEL